MQRMSYWVLAFFTLSLILVGCSKAASPDPATPGDLTGGIARQEPESPGNSPADSVATQRPATNPTQVPAGVPDPDILFGFTTEGFPYRGDPEAPITLEEYSDYLCPFCERHYNETLSSLIQQYVAQGKVQYVFRDMPLVSLHPTAPVGHKAARCVGEQSASAYWQMHDQLFRTQVQWSGIPDPSSFVSELAKSTGVDMDAFQECMASSVHETQINESVAAGSKLGFNGTPSFRFIVNESGEAHTLIGAYPLATFSEWIEALLAGEPPPEDAQTQEETPELPFWANDEGLAPDPDKPGYTLAGDQYKGNPKAELVVVEFSDFQCPACQSHALEVQPLLDQEFVESGKVLWVFKHLPLRIHPQALIAATAAECAAEQGNFWGMHDLLFAQVEDWSVDQPEPALTTLADTLGLDTEQFSACLSSREALERVVADMYDSQGVVSSTPNFVVLYGGRGTLLQSSREPEQFVEYLNGLLDSAAGVD